jgi:hypothetical protein
MLPELLQKTSLFHQLYRTERRSIAVVYYLHTWFRRKAAWMNLIAAFWVILLGATSVTRSGQAGRLLYFNWHELGSYATCVLGSIGCIAWGLKEARKERINLGIAGFALTILFFYFSTVMDKLGRAASLMGLGVLFLLGGWLLNRTRRRLTARLEKGAS